MVSSQAKRLVIVGGVGTGVLTAVAVVRRQREAELLRVAAGTVITTTVLAVIAEVRPDLAAGLALLMLTTAAFVLGGDAWQGIAAITQPGGIQ